MKGGLPDWQPFSLAPERATPLELSGMRGPALVLLAAPAADEVGWAVRAAARIAGQRATRHGRLVLADLDLVQPRLHMQVGADNGEGMSDLLQWGASLGRVSRPVEGGFRFAPAGTAVADPEPVLASPRWEPLLEGFEEAGVELFLYLPWDIPGRDSVLARARNVVILAARPELERLEAPDVEGLRVGAVLGPDGDGDVEAAPEAGAVDTPSAPLDPADPTDSGPPAPPDDPSASTGTGDAAAPSDAGADARDGAASPDPREPTASPGRRRAATLPDVPPAPKARESSDGGGWLLRLLLVLVAVALVVAAIVMTGG